MLRFGRLFYEIYTIANFRLFQPKLDFSKSFQSSRILFDIGTVRLIFRYFLKNVMQESLVEVRIR